ncbi:hypothetical protein QN277_023156 [Acacia crassicarpa]|uniref:Glycosyltransferase n=1 Tax=Acacia crassicarpa TaxID=499986 RepID=A0AAE1JGD8_9FABA|nr:hypothetical protein QN277_023156 [Acacia crassicarpa]
MASDGKTTAIRDQQQPHFLVLPCPVQGHINPMLQFCKRLKQEGARVTLVATRFCFNNTFQNLPSSIAIDTFSDGFDKGGVEEAESFKAYFDTFEEVGSETLGELIEKLASSGNKADGIVYDSFMPWVVGVAKRFRLSCASFLTQSLAISSVYYHLQKKKLDIMKMEKEIQLPGLPLLEPDKDLPSLVFAHQAHPVLFDVLLAQFSNLDEVDWILCNTFDELEKEVADWLKTIWPKLRTVGPTVPSMFLDKRLKEDEDYGLNLCKNEDSCLKWLDDKPKGSVVYVSFGSMSNIKETQMGELAYGLRDCDSFFLWVVRDYEESKLPKDFEKKSEKGLVVSWCPQLKVLSNEAVGCFLTHSGWNSTLEALCMGVPMVAVPQWTDQSLNAKNVKDVWKMGMRAQACEDGIVKRETLKSCIKEVMESEIGKEMKRNAIPWKASASKATDEGGSSQKHIQEFVESHHHKFVGMDKTESSSVTNCVKDLSCPKPDLLA